MRRPPTRLPAIARAWANAAFWLFVFAGFPIPVGWLILWALRDTDLVRLGMTNFPGWMKILPAWAAGMLTELTLGLLLNKLVSRRRSRS